MSNVPEQNQRSDLANLLENRSQGFLARHKWALLVAALAVIAAVLVLLSREDSSGPRYRTEPAVIDGLVVRVSATGHLQPTNQVEVGSELSGIVTAVFVDENDRVQQGQVLAQLDLSKLQDAVERSRAGLVAAEAQVLQAQATVVEKQAELRRFREISAKTGGGLPSRSEMDMADANAKRAMADEASARANVAQAQASVRSDVTNLKKASIRSPIDGVVLNAQGRTGADGGGVVPGPGAVHAGGGPGQDGTAGRRR